jgi:hypothetical protein
MPTQCNHPDLLFQPLGQRDVVGRFDGGTISSDGGCLLLGEAERLTGTLRQLTACFTDHRDADAIEHTVGALVAQRVYGLALGYEDLNDHDSLRLDPLLATLVGKGAEAPCCPVHRQLGPRWAGPGPVPLPAAALPVPLSPDRGRVLGTPRER